MTYRSNKHKKGDEVRHQKTNLHFFFIRHGQAQSNLTNELVCGRVEGASLTSEGFKQSESLGEYLATQKIRADKMFTSSLLRARQTGETIAPWVGYKPEDIVTVSNLDEIDHGRWENWPRKATFTVERQALMGQKGPWFSAPGGESLKQVQLRAVSWLEKEILENPEYINSDQPRYLLVVSHGATLAVIFQWILNFDYDYLHKMTIANASLSYFRFGYTGWKPKGINIPNPLSGLWGE